MYVYWYVILTFMDAEAPDVDWRITSGTLFKSM